MNLVDGLYVLGCLEPRVTIFSQQVRGLNLIYSLFKQKKIRRGSSLAVIGGGVAGLTAAAGALARGCKVTVFEQRKLLHMQWGCEKRTVHPFLFDWPHERALQSESGLEVLPWHAATAAHVAVQVREGWERTRSKYAEMCTVYEGISNISVVRSAPRVTLSWSPPYTLKDFEAVVLAVGFGVEKTIAPVPAHSYWRDDRLAQSDLSAKVYLISGTGDGGLIDLVRACYERFDHSKLIAELQLEPEQHPETGALAERLLKIESEARRRSESAADEYLTVEYQRLGDYCKTLDSLLLKRSSRRKVTLNGPSHFPWSTKASILNRLLASRLIALDLADYWHGPLKEGAIQRDGAAWSVTIGTSSRRFDEVIIRHGADPSIDVFAASNDVNRLVLKSRNALDQTREQIWPAGWFRDRMREPLPLEQVTTKAVVFDFGGTLTSAESTRTTWERMWSLCGYEDLAQCISLHARYRMEEISHATWCDLTCQAFQAGGFARSHLDALLSEMNLVPGIAEAIEQLLAREIALYIVSGSIKELVVKRLGKLSEAFKEIRANEMEFDQDGRLVKIVSTPYDFEGKAQFLKKVAKQMKIHPREILFVGNSSNDQFAHEAGVMTLCVNPRFVDPADRTIWTHAIREMRDLREILPHVK